MKRTHTSSVTNRCCFVTSNRHRTTLLQHNSHNINTTAQHHHYSVSLQCYVFVYVLCAVVVVVVRQEIEFKSKIIHPRASGSRFNKFVLRARMIASFYFLSFQCRSAVCAQVCASKEYVLTYMYACYLCTTYRPPQHMIVLAHLNQTHSVHIYC